MATLLGIEATKVAASPLQFAEQGKGGAIVKVMYDKYSFTSDLSAGDIIKFGPLLPANAKVIGGAFKATALSGGTIDLGWAASADGAEAADADGFLDGLAVTGATDCEFNVGTYLGTYGFWKEMAGAVQVQALIATDTSASSGTIEVKVYYVE